MKFKKKGIIKERNNNPNIIYKIRDILNVKLQYYNLIFILILFLQILISNASKNKLRKLNLDSIINIKIKGVGIQPILNVNRSSIKGTNFFKKIPSKIEINEKNVEIRKNMSYNLTRDINNITLFFNESLGDYNYMFYGLNNITEIDFKEFDSSSLTQMIGTFAGCKSLISLNISLLDTSKVNNMEYLFSECINLTILNINNLNTSKVTSMNNMFSNCENLISLDLSNFNTSSVISMDFMFYFCENLISLDLSNFDTSSVRYMNYMFYNCENLISLDLSNFNTSSVIFMNDMFSNCKNLISLDLSNFDTSSISSIDNIFFHCDSLFLLNIEKFHLTNQPNNLIQNISSLKYLTVNERFMINQLPNNNITFCIHFFNLNNSKFNLNIDCSNACFQKNKKILLDEKECIINCSESDYKYEYYNICYKSCPNGTHPLENSFICIEVFTKNKEENNTIEIISSISTESKNNINNINDILSNFSLDNFFKGEYEITNQTSEIKDTIIKKINFLIFVNIYYILFK